MSTRVELLDGRHVRADFDCGKPALNDFLQRQAGQQYRRGIGKTYVAVGDSGDVQGFVTISAGSVATATLPGNLRLPRYPIPILRIGRLAVDLRYRGVGLGQDLLSFALHLALEVSARIGLYAVVVDAKDDKAADFYRRHGFSASLDDPFCLFIPLTRLTQSNAP